MPTDDHGDGALTTTGTGTTSLAPSPEGTPPNGSLPRWQDDCLSAEERVTDLLGRMTLAEKIGQLRGAWVNQDSTDGVAPHQHDFAEEETFDWAAEISSGLGQLTRPFGTAPVEPGMGARALARTQAEVMAASRFGIPALAHEECLTGFMAWGATVYPTPLAWAATFDPELVERMAGQIGTSMRGVGVHQGLAPVLDVTRDPRWGRTEETLGEDPYLVATMGTAYVRGLEAAGVIATLKHFAGYSASRAGRNFGPVGVGPRELADVLLPPFEMAIRDGGARSAMASYAEIDGVPTTADPRLLTDLLRGTWGFEGTVVSDYFAVSFLETQHQVGGERADAAALALAAGVDVELPAARCYADPLLTAVKAGLVAESLVDRAARRVLLQKCELGLLDPGWSPLPPALTVTAGRSGQTTPVGATMDGVDVSAVATTAPSNGDAYLDLDPPEARALARDIAERSIVLLSNDGVLPLPPTASIALVGPQVDDPAAMLGCYTFPSHVGSQHPDVPLGVAMPTLLDALHGELPGAQIEYVQGCSVDGPDRSGIAAAVEAAGRAGVCVVALGDRSGLFGRGTVGEGSDAADLKLPGVQADLLTALLAGETPVVLVLLTGRPYALGGMIDRLAATVQAFFPGEEGGGAVAGVLSGRLNPGGRLPVSVPRSTGGQPSTYLAPILGHLTEVSSVDPTPLFPFGYGQSYTSFGWAEPYAGGVPVEPGAVVEASTGGSLTVSVAVGNTGDRAGTEVVQLYLHDPVAQVTRPVVRLIGYGRVRLEPGETRRITFEVHADLTSFTGRDGRRLVEPGELELRLAASSSDVREVVRVRLVGPERVVDHRRTLVAPVTVT
jgi:beta-xylosidase